MKAKLLQDAKRKKAWNTTKQAVRAYARNPCEATEVQVTAALNQTKRLCVPCAPASSRPKKQ